ncbi:glycoside hydrolase family 32 protein [Clostridium sp. SYSU_GA19001]|uniref:glycoside hydrolase family 32 protein n=1 Tax=Clostridium caldaquaticum TaxID=2940653 RepID=UPI00207717DE|nr:glycoside hydrolase family 32 protein [Clostridium caldaquaticum]MCM8711844.1 glycoside hydrolase family 32 protein [Clostridium caldaquaticum]
MKRKLYRFISLMIIFILTAVGCSKSNNNYKEKYRPQYHFSPEKNWMNDPCGMFYYEGNYHLFYQYNPNDTIWGPMHWGHATSPDMVTWTHLPVALEPDDLGTIFTGSSVVDSQNTSGLFDKGSGIVSLYTNDNKGLQQQSMAFSTDGGKTFNKYKGNPVLKNMGARDFRDPYVFWHDNTKKWIMVLAAGVKVEFYNSSDLKNWNYLSEFGSYEGSHGGVWECPGLFELPVDGDKQNMKWVLKVDVGDNAVGGGSGGQYFIGNFDGTKFTNDNSKTTTLWLDYGSDFYAAQSFSGAKADDGSYYWLGWMNNWKYAQLVPTERWRGQATLPRKVSLKSFPEGLRLVQTPLTQLESLRYGSKKINNKVISPDKNILKGYSGESYEIVAEFELGTAEEFGFKLRKSDSEETTVSYNTKNKNISLNRVNSGEVSFSEYFKRKYTAELKPVDNKIKLHIFVDASSVEVFGNDGKVVMTNLIYPDPKSKGIELYSKGGDVKLVNLEFYKLRSSWKK